MAHPIQYFGSSPIIEKLEIITGPYFGNITAQQKVCMLHFCTYSLISPKMPNMQIDNRIFTPVGQAIGTILEACTVYELLAIIQAILENTRDSDLE